MHKPLLFMLACALWACSDSSTQDKTDSGTDASDPQDESDAGQDAAKPSPLGERPPGSLERPPREKLPDDLKPPTQSR